MALALRLQMVSKLFVMEKVFTLVVPCVDGAVIPPTTAIVLDVSITPNKTAVNVTNLLGSACPTLLDFMMLICHSACDA